MPTRKKAAQSSKKSSGKAGSAKAAVRNGPLPPYGDPIRQAIARGDVQEMRKLAVTTRKWLRDVQSALDRLEKSINTKRA